MTRKIPIPNLDDLLRRYLAGESEYSLSTEAGVNRWTFRRRLIEAGIEPRGQSEAERLRWSRMTADERTRQVAAAHGATRGRTVPLEQKIRRAKALEGTIVNSSKAEIVMAGWLQEIGYPAVHNLAVGPYNCDLGAGPVAVEVWGGGWHPKPAEVERTKYILDAGYHVLIVDLDKRRFPLTRKVCDYFFALYELSGGDPAARREYWMVRGDGELIFKRLNSDDISLVPPFTSRRNPANGQYERAPR